MQNLLKPQQNLLLKRLISKIKAIRKSMTQEGLSSKDIHIFLITNVLQSKFNLLSTEKKCQKDFNSETQEETNSEQSQIKLQNFQIALQKSLTHKLISGQSITKILLKYIQNCFVQQEKLKNYLSSQESCKQNTTQKFDFQKVKIKIKPRKYQQSAYQSIQDLIIQKNQPSLSRLCSIKDRCIQRKSSFNQSEKQLDYLRSFEKSLNESIQKTKMLRNMLEKQMLSSFSIGNQQLPTELNYENNQIF